MSKYTVKVSSAPKGHQVPVLLRELGAFVKTQDHGALGWFDALTADAIPKPWDPANAARLQKSGFAFLSLPDGSLLALLNAGEKAPAAVVLLGSEGDCRTVASSLEAFLFAWAKGATEIDELDDEEGAEGRARLAKWLKEKKVKTPKAADFDFQAWLDGNAAAPAPPTKQIARRPTAVFTKLGPMAQKVASITGQRVDAPGVAEFVKKTLGKQLQQAVSSRDGNNVSAPKAGIELALSHEIANEAYPPIAKTAKSFVPYISTAWLSDKLDEPVLGVPWDVSSAAEVVEMLGKPMTMRGAFRSDKKKTVPVWNYRLDDGAEVDLEISFRDGLNVSMKVARARVLEDGHRVSTGLFISWAAKHGLLDEARLSAHAALLADVKRRKAQGTSLFDALGRGLWDVHLKNDDALRAFAYGWFHNLDGKWITADLKKVFGKRVGPHDHDEPKLDDDTWDAVEKAEKIFSQRFSAWMK